MRYPKPEGFALLRHVRLTIPLDRAPGLKLGDVFEEDHARALPLRERCPAQHHPCKAADLLGNGRAALGAAEVLAVRGEPRDVNRATGAQLCRPDRKHVFLQVQRIWMVRLVHGNRVGVMVDGDVDWTAERLFQRNTSATTTCEVVDYEAHYSAPRIAWPSP